jgi:hypothetical protein
MGRWNDHSPVWWSNFYFDRLGIIQWESDSVTLTYSISNCSLQNHLENRILFFTQFLAQFPFKIILNYYLSFLTFFYDLKEIKSNSFICPKASQQPTVSPNYFQSIKINIGPSDNRTTVQVTHRPTVLYWRLSDFLSWCSIQVSGTGLGSRHKLCLHLGVGKWSEKC